MANQRYRLSTVDYNKLIESERALLDMLPEMDNMEACGRDCQDRRAAAQDLLEKMQNVKKFYGPQPHEMV